MLIATLLAASIILTWSWVSEVRENGFEVERAPSPCADWTLIARQPADVMTMEDPVDVPGNCYRVRAFDSVRFYPYSNVAVVPAAEDSESPKVAITSPTDGSTVQRRSTVTIRAIFSDNVGVTEVRYIVGTTRLNCPALATSCNWSVPSPPNREHTIRVEARDAAGRVGSAQVSVRSGR